MDALQVIRDETAAFADVLDPAALDRRVPGCPDWTLGELAAHLGGVHRWAAGIVRTAPEKPGRGERERPPADPALLGGWLRDGAADLVDVLAAADPAAACWTFGPPPRVAGFWLRRQAVETALHRWDAESAFGPASAIDHDVAHAGVEEVLDTLVPARQRAGALAELPAALALECECGTTLALGDGEPAGRLAGSASELLLLLWKRQGPVGVDDAAGAVLELALTP